MLVIGLLLTSLKFYTVLDVKVPGFWGDEYRYLSRAMNFAQTGIPTVFNISGPNYPPLISFFLAPAYLPDLTPIWAYRVALLMMCGLALLLLWPAWKITGEFGLKNKTRVLILSLFSFLPNVFYYSVLARSELLALFWTLWIVWFVLRLEKIEITNGSRWWIFTGLGALTGLAILTRTFFVVLIPAVLVYFVARFFLFRRRETSPKFFHDRPLALALALVLFLVPALGLVAAWKSFDRAYIQPRNIVTPLNRYKQRDLSGYNSNKYLRAVQDIPAKLGDFTRVSLYHIAYLVTGSFFLAALFLLNLWQLVLRPRPGRQAPAPLQAFYLFTSILLLGVLALTLLHNYPGYAEQPEKYSLYARYLDPAVALLFLGGLLAAMTRRENFTRRGWILLGLALLVCVLAIPDLRYGSRRVAWNFVGHFRGDTHQYPFLLGSYLVLLGVFLVWRFRKTGSGENQLSPAGVSKGPGSGFAVTFVFFFLFTTSSFSSNAFLLDETLLRTYRWYHGSRFSTPILNNVKSDKYPVYAHTPSMRENMAAYSRFGLFRRLWGVYFLNQQPIRFVDHPSEINRTQPYFFIISTKHYNGPGIVRGRYKHLRMFLLNKGKTK